MKNKITYLLHTLAVVLLLGACGNQDYPVPDPDPAPGPGGSDDTEVTLKLRVSVLGDASPNTRADDVLLDYTEGIPDKDDDGDFEIPVTDYEKLKTLRVIIVDKQGNVEHNRMVNLDAAGNVINDNLEFEVSVPYLKVPVDGVNAPVPQKTDKRIWLFGNEKAADTDICKALTGGATPFATSAEITNLHNQGGLGLDLLSPGKSFPSAAVEGIELSRESGKPYIDNSGHNSTRQYIPMSEFFDVTVDPEKAVVSEGGTKLMQTADFFITRSLVKFTFSAQFGDSYPVDSEMRVSEIKISKLASNGFLIPYNTVYDPAKYTERPEGVEGRRITFFVEPADADNQEYTFLPTNFKVLKDEPTQKIENGEYVCSANVYSPMLYFPETKMSLQGDDKFMISIKTMVKSTRNGAQEEEVTFGPVELKSLNLNQLARNTHVYVNFKFYPESHSVVLTIRLVPYIGITLDPVFGFDDWVQPPIKDNESQYLN